MSNEKTIKAMPKFWTYLRDAKGVVSIHQAKFVKLVVSAYCDKTSNLYPITVVDAALKLGGREELFVAPCTMGREYNGCGKISLNNIFETKEDVEDYIRTEKRSNYPRVIGEYVGKGHIPSESVLYSCEHSWFSNIPANMSTMLNEKNILCLCAYRWNGLEVKHVFVDSDNDKDKRMLFDMVAREWITKPKHRYYKTAEECSKDNEIKVYLLDD